MATVGTTTQTDALAAPTAAITRDGVGNQYVPVRTGTDTITVYRSTDNGTTWASYAAFTQTGLAEFSGMTFTPGSGHIAYRISTTGGGGTDTIWYRRLFLANTSWSPGLQTSSSDSNGGVAGGTWQGVDIAAWRNGDGTHAIVVAAARTLAGRYGAQAMGVSITVGGTIYLNNPIIGGNRQWFTSGTAPGRAGVYCEIEHNGNGYNATSPHVWICWGRQSLSMVKLSWTGQSSGWSGPTTAVTIRAATGAALDLPAGRWDGNQWLMAVASPDNAAVVRVYQRNRANTATLTYDSPVHPQGTVRTVAVSYDNTTKNMRVYAVGTTTAVLYWVDYIRATSTWGAWTTVNASAVLNGGQEWGVRRGGTVGNARYDIAQTVAGSPNTVSNIQQTAATAPGIPVWTYENAPYRNGGAADLTAILAVRWIFSDADPGDAQSAYALSRQIGAAAVQYWNATTSTWGASEVQNATATTAVSLPANWGTNTDLPHTYKVKVWDSTGTPSAGYSDGLQLTPATPVAPTITAPTAGQVITTDTVTVTWTVAEQTAYEVQLFTPPPNGIQVYTTGKQTDPTTTSVTLPLSLASGSAWFLLLATWNNRGLSATNSKSFSVSYATPPAAVATVTPVPASGWMSVASAPLAPVGTQPAPAGQDLYRRVKTTSNTLPNSAMAGNVNGYSAGANGLVYSTAQFRSSPGSARVTPSGAVADAFITSTAVVAMTAGKAYTAGAWMRPDTANKNIKLQLNWLDSGGTSVGSESVIVGAIAGAWIYVEMTAATTLTTAARVSVSVGLTGTPAATDAFYADDITLTENNPDPGTRVAATLATGATYLDWAAPGATDLEYRWIVRGANGAQGPGPWQG